MPDTVIVAVRALTRLLDPAVMVIVSLPEPVVGLMFSHVTELAMLQSALDVILKVAVLLASAKIFSIGGKTDKLEPTCVTVTFWSVTPVAVTVTIAVRVVVSGLANAVKVTAPLFEPDAGLTDSHPKAEPDTFQSVLEVMLNKVTLLAPAFIVNVDVEVDKLGAACVTVIVWVATPVADKVIVSVRVVVPGLAVAVKVIVESFEPAVALKVSHVAVGGLLTFHSVFEVIRNVALLVPAFMVNADGETVNPCKMVILAVVKVNPGNKLLVISQ